MKGLTPMGRWIILCLMLFFCSCVSTQIRNQTNETEEDIQRKLTEEEESAIPKYNGAVRPTSDPIYVKYMPANIYAKFKLMDYEEIVMKSLISKKDDGLKWNMEFSGPDIGDEAILCESTTNYQGKISAMKTPPLFQEKTNNDIEEMGDLFYFALCGMFLVEFSSGPINSGDILYRFPDVNKFSGTFGGKDLEIQIASSKISAVLKGWEYAGDKKMFITDVRGKLLLRQLNNDLPPMKILVYGYSVIDSEKFYVVRAEVRYFMENIADDILLDLSYSSDIE